MFKHQLFGLRARDRNSQIATGLTSCYRPGGRDEEDGISSQLRAVVEQRAAQIRQLTERSVKLEEEIARLKKNSSNSSDLRPQEN